MCAMPTVRRAWGLLLLGLAVLCTFAAPAPAADDDTGEPLWSQAGLAKLLSAYHEALPGKIRALDFKIYSHHAQLMAQDPAKPENVDAYDYRGKVAAPVPVRLHGHGSLDANLFDLDDVAIDRLPALAAEALERVPLEGGAVSHILVKRNLPFSRDVQIVVYVHGTRKSGVLKADAKGRVLEAKSH